MKQHCCNIFCLLATCSLFLLPAATFATTPDKVLLNVPYTSQAPTGEWKVHQWWEACEEGSSTMVAYFYANAKKITVPQATATMKRMFAWEIKKWGSSDNTDAEMTADFIRHTTLVNTEVRRDPTIAEIKHELDIGHPVMALLDRYDLYSDLKSGAPVTSYHIVVIRGYDDAKGVFTVNDPARPGSAPVAAYSYTTIMNALHDFDSKTGEADGPPTVIFTSPKRVSAP